MLFGTVSVTLSMNLSSASPNVGIAEMAPLELVDKHKTALGATHYCVLIWFTVHYTHCACK